MNEPDRPSRRRLLASLAGVGTAGLLGGAATGAYLNDGVRFPRQRLQTGSLNLGLAWQATDGDEVTQYPSGDGEFPSAFGDDPHAAIPFDGIEPGDSGTVVLALRVSDASGHVWLRSRVGEGNADLAEVFTVRLRRAPECEVGPGGGGRTLLAGRLNDLLAGRLGAGVLIERCLPADTHRCVRLEWTFASGPDPAIAGESLTLAIECTVEQCRHAPDPENPWH